MSARARLAAARGMRVVHGACGQPPKYRNRRVALDGYTFDSGVEAQRYRELALELSTGLITDLEVHPRVKLALHGVPLTVMVLDFRYRRAGECVVEDVKGYRNPKDPVYRLFKLKAALHLALTGVLVTEITRRARG